MKERKRELGSSSAKCGVTAWGRLWAWSDQSPSPLWVWEAGSAWNLCPPTSPCKGRDYSCVPVYMLLMKLALQTCGPFCAICFFKWNKKPKFWCQKFWGLSPTQVALGSVSFSLLRRIYPFACVTQILQLFTIHTCLIFTSFPLLFPVTLSQSQETPVLVFQSSWHQLDSLKK